MISVIVPVYNTKKYLKRCVDSLACQTYPEYEIILIDDGSTDGSDKLCDEISSLNSKIRVIHQENGGLSKARNRGIDAAKGEYLSFIDSDDFVHPRMLELLHKNLMEYDADISVCSYWQLDEGEPIVDNICSEKVSFFEGHAIIRQLFENRVETVVAWNKLYKKEMFEQLRYAVGKLHEDEFIIHHLLYKCQRIVYSSCKLYYYLNHSESITGNLNDRRIRDTLEAFEQRAYFFETNGLLRERNETMDRWKREIRGKYKACKKAKFVGYKRTLIWLRKEMRGRLSELKEKGVITDREGLVQYIWTYCPVCGIILEYIATKKQKISHRVKGEQ